MDLEHKAIERIKTAAEISKKYYDAPLLLAYSGGKDSDVCLELCKRAVSERYNRDTREEQHDHAFQRQRV